MMTLGYHLDKTGKTYKKKIYDIAVVIYSKMMEGSLKLFFMSLSTFFLSQHFKDYKHV